MSEFNILGMNDKELVKSPNEYGSLLLAYIGDAVYELFVRYHLISQGIQRPQDLQQAAVGYVSAVSQAAVSSQVEEHLTDEEKEIFRRGRNARSGSFPKNVKVYEYRQSTGLEAVIGYLYLTRSVKRLQYLMTLILDLLEKRNRDGL